MAGHRSCWKLEYDRGILWIYSAIFVLVSISPIVASENDVLVVADANWTVILEGEWMLKFYAPWCPACQHLQNDWEGFSKLSEDLGISVGKVDVTRQPGLSGRFLVTTLPTIFHAKDGKFRRYMSSRSIEDFQAYISMQKWELVEPVSGWKSPSSFLMSGMAALFRLSVWIRHIHNYLTELGIPVWGSYIIFALVTLFTGLLLGLMLVLIADFFWPSRPKQIEMKPETKALGKEEGSEEELEDPVSDDKKAWDADNESEHISGEESTEDDVTPVTEVEDITMTATTRSDASTDLRKRRPQESQVSPEST